MKDKVTLILIIGAVVIILFYYYMQYAEEKREDELKALNLANFTLLQQQANQPQQTDGRGFIGGFLSGLPLIGGLY